MTLDAPEPRLEDRHAIRENHCDLACEPIPRTAVGGVQTFRGQVLPRQWPLNALKDWSI